MIIAVINSKGGVAKTATCVSLAATMAAKKKKTLLIDLDGQASASLSMGISRRDLTPSIADALLKNVPIKDTIRNTDWGVDVITGSMELAHTDVLLAAEIGRERKLKNLLKPIAKKYDYIFMDLPPSMGLLPVNALVAADYFLVPTSPQYLALEGLLNLLQAVDQIREGIGENEVAKFLGIVLTMVDGRRRATGEITELIRDHYKKKVFPAEIHVNSKMVEAPSFGQPITEYAPTSPVAVAYKELSTQIARRCSNGSKKGNRKKR